jgi:hypothetical protein
VRVGEGNARAGSEDLVHRFAAAWVPCTGGVWRRRVK